jgi:hypothetical protein
VRLEGATDPMDRTNSCLWSMRFLRSFHGLWLCSPIVSISIKHNFNVRLCTGLLLTYIEIATGLTIYKKASFLSDGYFNNVE